MLFTFLQMGTPSIEELIPFIIMGAFAAGDILLLKLALVVTKAQKRTRMKWVAGSFTIQFGIIFIISSPLFLLGFMGKFQGELNVIIPSSWSKALIWHSFDYIRSDNYRNDYVRKHLCKNAIKSIGYS